ncbi:O-antigen/teichoic acid export membrane protein [Rhodoligotrophos appendicifer]|uniref:lipopolysaccharide biosynthesis protein n=1 Tax=Rhodoligotrophos appendicifer TaxID=987056 RepID=UPI0014788AA9|nr:oligosaccharide flippase family protein [Rhodoligotrophos appendicifer]
MARSGFLRSVAKLSTGQLIAAAIPILAAPLLGRLYVPSDYGILATYMAYAHVLASVSTLQFHQAILAELRDERAEQLVAVCFWASVPVALGGALLGACLYVWMGGTQAYSEARGWILCLPLSILASGTITALSTMVGRYRRFGLVARNQVSLVAFSTALSVILGLYGYGADGLLFAYLGGQAVSLTGLLIAFHRMRPRRRVWRASRRRIIVLAKRHRSYPRFALPAAMMNSVNQQIPSFALSFMGLTAVLGSFVRARQLMAAPMSLLGTSISQVFRQHASHQYRQTGSCREIYLKTLIGLSTAGLMPTLLLSVYAPELFTFILGPNWTSAGETARLLVPVVFLRFLSAPLSSILYFTGAQKLGMILSGIGFLLIAGAVCATAILSRQGELIILAYSASASLVYLAHIVACWRLSRQ